MSLKILIVDDEESNRSLLGVVLTRVGHEVQQAFDGQSALEIVDDSFDVAFVDRHLPGMSGLELVKSLRQISEKMFIVTATMDDDPTTIEAAYEAGSDMFLVKPYNIAQLPNLVKEATRGRRWIMDRLGLRLYQGG